MKIRNKISEELIFNLFVTVLTGIFGFILNKVFSVSLGIEKLGLMKLFTQMLAYLNLAELGIGSAASYILYKPLLEEDTERISVIVGTIDKLYKKIAVFILLLGGIISIFLPFIVHTNEKKIYLYWALYVLNTSISYLYTKYIILFSANQEYMYVRKVQGIGKLLFQFLQIICLFFIKSFIVFIILISVENIYYIYSYRKHYIKNYKYISKKKEEEKKILVDMKKLFWHKIGGLVVHNTDYIILSTSISLDIVGIYSSYLLIYQTIKMLLNIATPVLSPRIGKNIVRLTKDEAYLYWRKIQIIYIYLSTVIVISTYLLIVPFIKLWLGDAFVISKVTILLILVNLFMDLSRIVTDIFKFAYGFFDDIYTPALESVINLLLSLILVRSLGLDGVIFGTIISNFVIILILKPILVFKKCFQKEVKVYAKDFLLFLLLIMISLVLTHIVFSKIELNGIATWISFVRISVLIGGSNFIIVFFVFLLDKYFRKNLLMLLRLLKN